MTLVLVHAKSALMGGNALPQKHLPLGYDLKCRATLLMPIFRQLLATWGTSYGCVCHLFFHLEESGSTVLKSGSFVL